MLHWNSVATSWRGQEHPNIDNVESEGCAVSEKTLDTETTVARAVGSQQTGGWVWERRLAGEAGNAIRARGSGAAAPLIVQCRHRHRHATLLLINPLLLPGERGKGKQNERKDKKIAEREWRRKDKTNKNKKNKQTNKQTSKQINKQTNKLANKQSNKQTI